MGRMNVISNEIRAACLPPKLGLPKPYGIILVSTGSSKAKEGKKSHMSNQKVSSKGTSSSECDRPTRENGGLNSFLCKEKYASPQPDLSDITTWIMRSNSNSRKKFVKMLYFGCLDRLQRPLVMNFSSCSLLSFAFRQADFCRSAMTSKRKDEAKRPKEK